MFQVSKSCQEDGRGEKIENMLIGHNHFFPAADSLCGGGEGPSKAFAGQAGGDRPRSWGGCRSTKLFTQP